MLVFLLALQLAAKPALPACVQIEGDRILAKHAAERAPIFKTVPPDTVLSFGPSVGNRRIVSKREVERWAARFALTLPADIQSDGMCFERAAHPLSRGEVEAAIRRSLPKGGDIRIELVEISRFPAPAGVLEFPLSGAVPPPKSRPGDPFLWHGQLRGDSGGTYGCWARVRLIAKRQAVRTRVDLGQGKSLGADELEAFTAPTCPLLSAKDERIQDYAGLTLKRGLKAGTVLTRAMVMSPPDIARGNLVLVRVVAGATHLTLEAQAESDGYTGRRILLTNIESKRHFQGVVQADGTVLVQTPQARLQSASRNRERNYADPHTISKTDL